MFHKKEGNNIYFFVPAKYEKKLINLQNKKRVLLEKKMASSLTNHDFSFVCDCCLGGTICHDLKEIQRSPFVNLQIYTNDFLKLCTNLVHYLNFSLVFIKKDIKYGREYIVAKLDDIEMHFIYDNDFNELKLKWERRLQRFNIENLFIICCDGLNDGVFMNENQYKTFLSIPYRNKILITNDKNKKNKKNVVYMKKYKNNKMFYPGSRELFSPYRVYERYFDIVDWLNSNHS